MDLSSLSSSIGSSAPVAVQVKLMSGASDQLEAVMGTLLEGIANVAESLPDGKGRLLNVTA